MSLIELLSCLVLFVAGDLILTGGLGFLTSLLIFVVAGAAIVRILDWSTFGGMKR